MAKNRNYSCKDVDMLLASKTIAESFRANISELSAIRTVWTEQYALDLLARIDNAAGNFLGTNAKKDLRTATATLVGIQTPAIRDVSFFKVQVSADFRNDPVRLSEILNSLGYARFMVDVQKGNQEALTQLLYAFKSNMTPALRTEIMAKGMSATLIDNIIGYSETFHLANEAQESFKGSTKSITQEISNTFNALYAEIMDICSIASAYYKYDSVRKQQFTFSKVLSHQGSTKKASSNEPAAIVQ
jgi:hypothetical protein